MKRDFLAVASVMALIVGLTAASAQMSGGSGSSSGSSGGGVSSASSGPGSAHLGPRGSSGTSSQPMGGTAPSSSGQTSSPSSGQSSGSGTATSPGSTLGSPSTGSSVGAGSGSGTTTGPTAPSDSQSQDRTLSGQTGSQNQLHPSLRALPSAPNTTPQQPQFLGSGGKAQGGSVPGGSLVALTAEERRKIREIILAEHVAQEPRADFKLHVGAKVPENVPLNPLPSKVLEIQPRYKEFGFVIASGRIVIVQRGTREIDTMIPI